MKITTSFKELHDFEACTARYRVLAKGLGGVKLYGRETPISMLQILDICGVDDLCWTLGTLQDLGTGDAWGEPDRQGLIIVCRVVREAPIGENDETLPQLGDPELGLDEILNTIEAWTVEGSWPSHCDEAGHIDFQLCEKLGPKRYDRWLRSGFAASTIYSTFSSMLTEYLSLDEIVSRLYLSAMKLRNDFSEWDSYASWEFQGVPAYRREFRRLEPIVRDIIRRTLVEFEAEG